VYVNELSLDSIDWILERCSGPTGNLSALMPNGFDGYVRLCHPAYRIEAPDRSDTRSLELAAAGFIELRYRSELRWDDMARAMGFTPSRLMQWPSFSGELLRVIDAHGIEDPLEGELTLNIVNNLFDVLVSHHGEAQECVCGFWLGFRIFDTSANTLTTYPGMGEHALCRASLKEIQESWTALLEDERSLGLKLNASGLTPNIIFPRSKEWYLAIPFNRPSSYFGGQEKVVSDLLSMDKLETFRAYPTDNIWRDD